MPPGRRERLLDAAAGNPLVLLELPVELAGEPPAAATALERLQRSFAQRIEKLPRPPVWRSRLLLPTRIRIAVRRAVERSRPRRRDLSLSRDGPGSFGSRAGRLVFRHPRRALARVRVAGSAERRAAHRALARALSDEADRDRRAWHLAAAAVEPDDELAGLLEETADRAAARGGHAAAARALERAARLSTDSDARARRLTQAGRLAFWAGEPDRGCRLAEEAIDGTTDANLRADALSGAGVDPRRCRTTGYIGDASSERAGELWTSSIADRAARLLLYLSGRVSSSLDTAAGLATADSS